MDSFAFKILISNGYRFIDICNEHFYQYPFWKIVLVQKLANIWTHQPISETYLAKNPQICDFILKYSNLKDFQTPERD